jgi:2-hydroxy-6-oxonona-2,4-dienedioate hydrolase
VIVDFALRFPDRVHKAVLTAPTIDSRVRGSVREILRGCHDLLYEPPSLIPILIRDYLYAGLHRTLDTLNDAEKDPIRQELVRVHVPTLVVRGQYDTVVSQDWAEEVAGLLPNGHLAVIPGGAHAVVYDAAPRLAPLVRDFLVSA